METEQKIYKFAANFPRFNYVCLGNQDTAAAIGDWTECGSRTKPSDGEILATDQRDNHTLAITYWECVFVVRLVFSPTGPQEERGERDVTTDAKRFT